MGVQLVEPVGLDPVDLLGLAARGGLPADGVSAEAGDVLAAGLVGVEVVVSCAEGEVVYRVAKVRIVAYGTG